MKPYSARLVTYCKLQCKRPTAEGKEQRSPQKRDTILAGRGNLLAGEAAAQHSKRPYGCGCRLSSPDNCTIHSPGSTRYLKRGLREADEFYQAITPPQLGEDEANVMRQALGGMLWGKQYYFLEADKWLEEHGVDPTRTATRQVRNSEWVHIL